MAVYKPIDLLQFKKESLSAGIHEILEYNPHIVQKADYSSSVCEILAELHEVIFQSRLVKNRYTPPIA